MKIDEKIKLHIWDKEGNTVYVESDDVVQKAIKVSLTEEKLLDQLSKLGNTPFLLGNLEISLDDNSSVPVSVLNNIRRDAIDKLVELRKNNNNRVKIDDISFKEKMENILRVNENHLIESEKNKRISIKVDTIEQLKVILKHPIDRIYYGDLSSFKEAIALCKNRNVQIYLRTPSILRNNEYTKLNKIVKELRFDGILAGDLGIINFNNNNFKLPVVGDYSLNIMNSYTINSFKDIGLNGITISPELDFNSIYKLNLHNESENEGVIYGKMTVMTTEYCPLIQENQCNHKCNQCSYVKYKFNYGLKDIKGAIFPFGKDYWGRSVILNSKPLFMLDKLHDFKDINIEWLRLEFTDETLDEVENLLTMTFENVQNAITGKKYKSDSDFSNMLRDGFTRGHYYRGVE